MALSNIRREPRREITESILGILAVIVALGVDYFVSNWAHVKSLRVIPTNPVPIGAGMVLIPLCLFVLFIFGTILLYATHSIGESVCGWLSDIGMDPRPKQRRR